MFHLKHNIYATHFRTTGDKVPVYKICFIA